ncbi:hypothetical protein ACJJTC_013242 [Scirpophaga incertulas]
MRTHVLIVSLCTVFASGKLTTSKQGRTNVLDIGDKLYTGILILDIHNYTCYLETPLNDIIRFKPDDNWDKSKYDFTTNDVYGCRVIVNITSVADNGYWQLYYKVNSSNSEEAKVTYYVTVRNQDDKDQSAEDENILIYNTHFFNSRFGVEHTVTIVKDYSIQTKACYIIAPSGKIYHQPESPKRSVKWVKESHLACGVQIRVDTEDMVGNWTLFSMDIRESEPFERRQPFWIYVEEIVTGVAPQMLEVIVGDNFNVRLFKNPPIHQGESCKLVGPNNIYFPYIHSNDDKNKCSFIVQNASVSHTGTWHIVYGRNVIYKVPIDIKVYETNPRPTELVWTIGAPIDIAIGPNDAIYCRAIAPNGDIVLDISGRCHINIERVSQQHAGVWRFIIGTSKNIKTEKLEVFVAVKRFNPTYNISTNVMHNHGLLKLTCKGPGNINSCYFKQPNGEILLASVGDILDLIGNNITLKTSVSNDSCSLLFTNPNKELYGYWRCFLQIENDTAVYSNILHVSVDNHQPPVAPYYNYVERMEGHVATMLCSYPAAIDYCYFRAPNGTLYNVIPEMKQDSYEYFGASFFLGECGIKFDKAFVQDSGNWTCHVGPLQERKEEQTAQIELRIFKFEVSQTRKDGAVVIGGSFLQFKLFDSCRFVRADGVGFSCKNEPYGYECIYFNYGCGIRINNPDKIDLLPWTVVLRITEGNEVWGRTEGLLKREPRYDIIAWLWTILLWLGVISCTMFVTKSVVFLMLNKKETIIYNENQFKKPSGE